MAQDINQFGQTTEQGVQDMTVPGNVVSVQISPSESGSLIAGQAVKIEDSANGIPRVLALTADTDVPFGILLYNGKNSAFTASQRAEVGLGQTVVYMTAGGAIPRGSDVEYVRGTNRVIAAAGVNPVIGFAFDKAAANGDLIRVYLRDYPNRASSAIRTANVTATLAEINAGKTIIPGVAGKSIRVVGFVERVTGGFASTTSVDLQSSNATPVKVVVNAVAALTNGAVLVPGSANVTLGAGYGVNLGAGDSLVVANVGSAATGGTSIQFTIQYALV